MSISLIKMNQFFLWGGLIVFLTSLNPSAEAGCGRLFKTYRTQTPKIERAITPDQKVALVGGILSKAFNQPIETFEISDARELKRLRKQAHLSKNKPLTSVEAYRLIDLLIERAQKATGNRSRFSLEPDLSPNVRRELRKDPRLTQILNEAIEMGTIAKSGLFKRARLWREERIEEFRIARSVLINATLIWMGLPPLYFPLIQLSRWIRTSEQAGDAIRAFQLKQAELLLKNQMGAWRLNIDRSILGLRRLYHSLVLGVGIYIAAARGPELVENTVGLVKALQRQHAASQLSEKDMRSYESNNYDPRRVVEEDLKSWLESFDERPSQQEIDSKRAELTELEKEGFYKLYLTPNSEPRSKK